MTQLNVQIINPNKIKQCYGEQKNAKFKNKTKESKIKQK